MSNNPVAEQIVRAALTKLDSSRQEALAVIQLYLNHPAGVAEHSGIVEEISKAAVQLAEAEEAITALRRHFFVTENNTNDNNEE